MNTKNIGRILACGTLLLAGCGNTIRGVYEGYPIEVYEGTDINSLKMYENGKNKGYIAFTDHNQDGKVDSIRTSSGLDNNSSLRKYGSFEEGDKIFEQMLRQGEGNQEKKEGK